MSTILYLLGAPTGDGWGNVQVGGPGPPALTMATGWTVGTTGAGNYAKMAYGTERASSAFSATPVPGTAPDNTLKDAFRAGPLTGHFAAGDWTVNLGIIADTQAGGADGRPRIRVFQSSNADGSASTELTVGAVSLSIVTNVSLAYQLSTGTVAMPELNLTDHYLFFCLAWEITGAAS